jgi:hypothetical protein
MHEAWPTDATRPVETFSEPNRSAARRLLERDLHPVRDRALSRYLHEFRWRRADDLQCKGYVGRTIGSRSLRRFQTVTRDQTIPRRFADARDPGARRANV